MIKVLIVDDSALMREFLKQALSCEPTIKVVGVASDAESAQMKIRTLAPDVVTLDVLMPDLDGITFLKSLMRQSPLPVIMVSSLTGRGTDIALRALELGAVDVIGKPDANIADGIAKFQSELIGKIKASAQTAIRHRNADAGVKGTGHRPSPKVSPTVIAIGASMGGVVAIKEVLVAMPPGSPPVLIAQHILPSFTRLFAERLDSLCRITVREAEDNAKVLPGHAYIAPGDRHLTLARNGASYFCRLTDGPPVNGHRPSVDCLFDSVASTAGAAAIGVLMTGMGRDGANGLRQMRAAGAVTACQDEASSLIYGMPKAAMAIGAAEHSLPLHDICHFILERARSMELGRSARRLGESDLLLSSSVPS